LRCACFRSPAIRCARQFGPPGRQERQPDRAEWAGAAGASEGGTGGCGAVGPCAELPRGARNWHATRRPDRGGRGGGSAAVRSGPGGASVDQLDEGQPRSRRACGRRGGFAEARRHAGRGHCAAECAASSAEPARERRAVGTTCQPFSAAMLCVLAGPHSSSCGGRRELLWLQRHAGARSLGLTTAGPSPLSRPAGGLPPTPFPVVVLPRSQAVQSGSPSGALCNCVGEAPRRPRPEGGALAGAMAAVRAAGRRAPLGRHGAGHAAAVPRRRRRFSARVARVGLRGALNLRRVLVERATLRPSRLRPAGSRAADPSRRAHARRQAAARSHARRRDGLLGVGRRLQLRLRAPSREAALAGGDDRPGRRHRPVCGAGRSRPSRRLPRRSSLRLARESRVRTALAACDAAAEPRRP